MFSDSQWLFTRCCFDVTTCIATFVPQLTVKPCCQCCLNSNRFSISFLFFASRIQCYKKRPTWDLGLLNVEQSCIFQWPYSRSGWRQVNTTPSSKFTLQLLTLGPMPKPLASIYCQTKPSMVCLSLQDSKLVSYWKVSG